MFLLLFISYDSLLLWSNCFTQQVLGRVLGAAKCGQEAANMVFNYYVVCMFLLSFISYDSLLALQNGFKYYLIIMLLACFYYYLFHMTHCCYGLIVLLSRYLVVSWAQQNVAKKRLTWF